MNILEMKLRVKRIWQSAEKDFSRDLAGLEKRAIATNAALERDLKGLIDGGHRELQAQIQNLVAWYDKEKAQSRDEIETLKARIVNLETRLKDDGK